VLKRDSLAKEKMMSGWRATFATRIFAISLFLLSLACWIREVYKIKGRSVRTTASGQNVRSEERMENIELIIPHWRWNRQPAQSTPPPGDSISSEFIKDDHKTTAHRGFCDQKTTLKQFVYLVQAADPKPDNDFLQPNSERDVLWFSWLNKTGLRGPIEQHGNGALSYFKTGLSWTAGRNFLLERAMEHDIIQKQNSLACGGKTVPINLGYLYYVFLDDDFLHMAKFTSYNWTMFETWLRNQQPAVGFLIGSMRFQSAEKRFNVDGNMNAFHSTTIGTLIPYDTTLDSEGIYFSQYIQNMMVAALYASQRKFWPGMIKQLDQTANNHNANASKYKRSHEWRLPKIYMSTLWKSNKGCFSQSFDLVNCNSTQNNRRCEYGVMSSQHILEPRLNVTCGPVDRKWILLNMNASHPFAVQKLDFIHQHKEFFALQQNSCPSYSFVSLACAMYHVVKY